MPIRHESWGGRTQRIPVLALALVLALTVEPVDSLSPEDMPPITPARVKKHIKSPRRPHRPHHAHKRLTPEEVAARQVTPEEFAAWSKVAVCEEGGDWHVEGSEYSGGLGISTYNWDYYGGKFFAPTGAQATPQEQIVIAERIQPNPPDQYGCAGGW